ncbi:MAG: ribosomal protein S18-alanine N-acetyltransferase [Candidatus Hydrothermales bacterium]
MRKAKLRDLPEILKIEREVFPDPWSIYSFIYELKNPANYFTVLELDGMIIGYLIAGEYEKSYHLKNIAVRKNFQSMGYGKILLEDLIKKAKRELKSYIFLEVRVTNERAIKFYEKFGFKKVRLIRGYYSFKEDAYEYLLKLNKDEENQGRKNCY